LQYCRRKLQSTRKEGRTKRWVGGQDRGARAGLGAKTGNTVECIQSVLKDDTNDIARIGRKGQGIQGKE
jgi:hypothetical protein